jgi:bacterial/archaeal transporter family-2 protein
MVWVYLLISLLAGALMPLQAGVNAQLARWVGGSAAAAALVSFAVGTLGLFVYCVALRAEVPTWSVLASAPWWVWFGGLLGAVFVTAAASLAPRLGAATFISLAIAGQMLVSILLDQFALVGFASRPATPLRLLGALLLVAGVLLIRKF